MGSCVEFARPWPTRRSAGLDSTSRRRECVGNRLPLLLSAAVIATAVYAAPAFGQAEAPAAKPEAQEPVAGKKREGRLVRIGLPITSGDDAKIRSHIQRLIEPLADQTPRHLLVLEFHVKRGAEQGQEKEYAQASEFGPAYELAKYLSELSRVQKIAYIPTMATGHAVLVAMACDEIHIASDAVIGEAGIAEEGAIDAVRRSGYKTIFERRRTIPLAIALGMLDSDLVVYQADTDAGREFILAESLEEERKTKLFKGDPTILIQRGQFGKFTGSEGRNLGFVKFLPRSREHLATELELPLEALEEDPSLGEAWRTLLIAIDGPIDPRVVNEALTNIDSELRERDVNFICVRLESGGGDAASSERLANRMAEFEPGQVRTVAYIGGHAKADAALVAMACDHVVMRRGEDVALGGTPDYEISVEEIERIRESVRQSLAPAKGRNWSLVAALIDPEIELYRYTRQGERDTLVEFFSPEEAAEREKRDGQPWVQGELVKPAGEALELSGERAKELGLVNHVVDDFSAFKAVYNIDDDLVEPRSNWAHELIRALSHPGLAWLLLAVAFGAMYIELHTPGLGIAGFISGLCIMVYFWGHFLNGTAEWLEVLLFAGGVMCVLLEFFVLPGFGVFGFGGGAMIIASLILASQTFVFPRSDYEVSEFRNSLMGVGLGIAGCIAMAFALRTVLPRTRFFGHMALLPPEGEAAEAQRQREAIIDFTFLIGQQGTMTTPCSPAGIAKFDDELIHVVSDGDFIPRGASVVAIEAHGNRVVVRATERV
jgi:membrane-bound serine protease (ClpP class)